jgi:stage III sporulation protein AB
MVMGGFLVLGIRLGGNMQRRIYELREVERIMGMLEGEMRYRKNPLGQCFRNIGNRCGGVYGDWLLYVAETASGVFDGGFMSVWNDGLAWLGRQSDRICIRREDIDGLKYMGQALTEGDIDTQINALMLEKTVLHNRITELSNEVNNRKRIALSLSGLGGILVVICLAL